MATSLEIINKLFDEFNYGEGGGFDAVGFKGAVLEHIGESERLLTSELIKLDELIKISKASFNKIYDNASDTDLIIDISSEMIEIL